MGITRADFSLFDDLDSIIDADLREDTRVETENGERYLISNTDQGAQLTLDNGRFAIPVGNVTPAHFGVVGDGMTDDYDNMVRFIRYIRALSTAFRDKLPDTNFKERNVNITIDFGNIPIALSETLTIDGCNGVRFQNATFYPHSTYTGTDPLIYGFRISSLKLKDITFQCNFVCSGFHLEECPLFEIDGVSIYGCGKQPYGMRFSPLNYSTSGKITDCNVFGWPSFHNQLLPADRTSRNIWIQNNDVMITSTNAAAGLVCMDIDGEGVQIDNCHVWNGYPSDHTIVNTTKPLGIRSLSDGHLSISNSYIDNSVIWIFGKDKSITDNFFITAGTLDIDSAIVLEPFATNSTAQDIVITGNRCRGQYDEFIDIENNSKMFNASSNVLIRDNIRRNPSNGQLRVQSTQGLIKVFVTPTNFDADNKITVDVSNYIAIPDSSQIMLASVGIRLLANLTSDIYSSWVFYDGANEQLIIRFNTTFSGDVLIEFDQSGALVTDNPV